MLWAYGTTYLLSEGRRLKLKGSIVGNMISCTDFPVTQGYAIEISNGTDAVVMGNVMYDNSWPGVNTVESSGVRLLANVGADDVPTVAP